MLPVARKMSSFLRSYPGAFILSLFLILISLATLKPNFYIVGWDNYSSYFNNESNLFRTFFHTWRSFRGLGVPSDSEVTDVFRQLFHYVFHFVFSEQLVDQLYIIACLWLGGLSSYLFAKRILGHLPHTEKGREIAATIAAFLYLCNLNTLAMFYFPIITYITRFASIPLLFLLFYEFLNRERYSKKFITVAAIIFFFTSGSYITGTVFITMAMSLVVYLLFQGKRKRSIGLFIFFGMMNAFWLLPFANYTKEKSAIIRLPPTFIDANESQLNKGKSFYDPIKQFILYPNFFETEYTSIQSQQKEPFHPLVKELTNPWEWLMVFLFPVLYLGGIVTIFAAIKKRFQLLWIPILILGYLFLSMKEYSPLGFIYHWLDVYLPYFGVLFRFGDTKFHPFIAFAGSISSSIFLLSCVSLLQRYLSQKRTVLFLLPTLVLICLIVIPFRRYMSEGMLGFFMYVRLPAAYQEIATAINTDSQQGRVLHLPFDRDQYWKSYSWGALGSSFFHYLIDKPFIDKTFEPASMENAYLHKRISDLTWGIQLLPTQTQQKRANEFYELMKKTGTRYLVLDESVSSYIATKGIVFGGNYNTVDIAQLVAILVKDGKATEQLKRPIINPVYPARLARNPIETSYDQSLTLYTLDFSAAEVRSVEQSEAIDPLYQNILEHEDIIPEQMVIQSSNHESSTLFPLMRDDGQLTIGGKSLGYTMKLTEEEGQGFRTVSVPSSKEKIISVTYKRDGTDVVFLFTWVYLPTINGKTFSQPLGEVRIPLTSFHNSSVGNSAYAFADWEALGLDYQAPYRLVVNDVVIPFGIPSLEEKEIGVVGVNEHSLAIAILEKNAAETIPLETISLTEQPNCFGDATPEYTNGIDRSFSGLRVHSKNGSTCFWTGMSQYLENIRYAELLGTVRGAQENLDGEHASFPDTSKPTVREYVRSLPTVNTFRVCISQGQGGDCFNKHQLLNLQDKETSFVVPFDRLMSTSEQMSVVFALKPVGYQSQSVTFSSLSLDLYEVVKEASLDTSTALMPAQEIPPLGKELYIDIPFALSPQSYLGLAAVDLPYLSNRPCDGAKAYRTFTTIEQRLLSYVENCYNQLYIDGAFSSESFLLWGAEYYLNSGKFPKMQVNDKLLRYLDRYASVYQGYPDISGFKNLQTPEYFFTSNNSIKNDLAKSSLTTTSMFIPPSGEGDSRRKQFALLSHAENEGIVSIGKEMIAFLPAAWRKLEFSSPQAIKSYPQLSVMQRTMLPSVREVKLTTSQGNVDYLMKFDEGYDRQWVAFGGGVQVKDHSRCDGYANCFTVATPQAGTYTLTLLYLPEILSFMGWGITLVTFFSTWVWVRSRHTWKI